MMSFEGIPNNTLVGNFYSAQGVFWTGATASIDSDAGGTGSFANEPSPSTVIFGTAMTMNVATGFTGPFFFWYNGDTIGTVELKPEPNGVGPTMGSYIMGPNRDSTCVAAGDPNPPSASTNVLCWTLAVINFPPGRAYSVIFPGGGTYFYDDILLGDVQPVPEPASLRMMLTGGLAGLLFGRRFLARRNTTV